MKKLLRFIFPLLMSILGSSDGFSQQDQSEKKLEQDVFYQIFPSLLDSIHFDRRLIPPPPPPPEYLKKRGFDMENNSDSYTKAYEDWKKSDDYKKQMNEWESRKDSIERDTTAVYLIIPDSTGRTEENDIRELIKHFGDHNVSTDSFSVSDPFRIELSKLKTNCSKVKFIYQSKVPGDGEFWRNDHGKYIAASLGFSTIIFDKTRKYGVLNAGYVMAPLNGYGVRIFIKQDEDGRWIVDAVKGTWIS